MQEQLSVVDINLSIPDLNTFARKSDNPFNIGMKVLIPLWFEHDNVSALRCTGIIYDPVYQNHIPIPNHRVHGLSDITDLMPEIPHKHKCAQADEHNLEYPSKYFGNPFQIDMFSMLSVKSEFFSFSMSHLLSYPILAKGTSTCRICPSLSIYYFTNSLTFALLPTRSLK